MYVFQHDGKQFYQHLLLNELIKHLTLFPNAMLVILMRPSQGMGYIFPCSLADMNRFVLLFPQILIFYVPCSPKLILFPY